MSCMDIDNNKYDIKPFIYGESWPYEVLPQAVTVYSLNSAHVCENTMLDGVSTIGFKHHVSTAV